MDCRQERDRFKASNLEWMSIVQGLTLGLSLRGASSLMETYGDKIDLAEEGEEVRGPEGERSVFGASDSPRFM